MAKQHIFYENLSLFQDREGFTRVVSQRPDWYSLFVPEGDQKRRSQSRALTLSNKAAKSF